MTLLDLGELELEVGKAVLYPRICHLQSQGGFSELSVGFLKAKDGVVFRLAKRTHESIERHGGGRKVRLHSRDSLYQPVMPVF